MSNIIFPRSPREMMDGWVHLPRYVDKIRLQLAGQLHSDYQTNFGKGFDGFWLKAAGVSHEQMIEVVKRSITDGQVCDWVKQNVKRSAAEKEAFAEYLLSFPKPDDVERQERLKKRKLESRFSEREDIKTYAHLIDADEKRI